MQWICHLCLYTWVERGTVTIRVRCLAQEHNTLSPARAQTLTTWSRASTLTSKRNENIKDIFNPRIFFWYTTTFIDLDLLWLGKYITTFHIHCGEKKAFCLCLKMSPHTKPFIKNEFHLYQNELAGETHLYKNGFAYNSELAYLIQGCTWI